jgi:hypothetical protein
VSQPDEDLLIKDLLDFQRAVDQLDAGRRYKGPPIDLAALQFRLGSALGKIDGLARRAGIRLRDVLPPDDGGTGPSGPTGPGNGQGPP